MESDARPPEKLSNKEPMALNWKRWKKSFLTYMKLTGGIKKSEDEQVAWLKNLIGQVGLQALENISFDKPEDEENMTIVMEKLDLFFDPPKNEVEERHKFFSRSKKNNESIDDYVDDLKEIAKLCNFGEQMESLVRDAAILDLKDKHLRELLFAEKDLNLEKLKIMYKTYEINTAKMKAISKEVIPETTKSVEKKWVPPASSATREPKNNCWRCREKHPQRECPAWKSVCSYCKQLHHFSHCCPVAKLDKAKTIAESKAAVKMSSPFRIEKDFKPNYGNKNNLSLLAGDAKDKNYVKRETLHSDPVLKNFETVESGNPKKVQNQFSCRNNLGKQSPSVAQVTSQHPLSQTTTGMSPSAPSTSLLDLNAQRSRLVSQSFPGKQEFQTNQNKTVEPSEKQQQKSNNYQLPRPLTPPVNATRSSNSLYPHLPSTNSATSQYSQKNVQSNDIGRFSHFDSPPSYNNVKFHKPIEKPKKKPDSDCVIS